jgi:hypothetical protein
MRFTLAADRQSDAVSKQDGQEMRSDKAEVLMRARNKSARPQSTSAEAPQLSASPLPSSVALGASRLLAKGDDDTSSKESASGYKNTQKQRDGAWGLTDGQISNPDSSKSEHAMRASSPRNLRGSTLDTDRQPTCPFAILQVISALRYHLHREKAATFTPFTPISFLAPRAF